MLGARLRSMAVALHKVAVPLAGQLSSSPLNSRQIATSSVSPLLQPWWSGLSQSLSESVRLATSQPSLRRHSLVARAAVEDVATAAESDAAPLKTKAMPKRVSNIMTILNDEAVAAASKDKIIPNIRTGDVLAMRVEVPQNKKRVSLIRGIVIAKRNAGINTTFRIRRVMAGVGVEMVFPLYSPNIKEIKVVDRRRARRAKLYYLRNKIAKLSTVK